MHTPPLSLKDRTVFCALKHQPQHPSVLVEQQYLSNQAEELHEMFFPHIHGQIVQDRFVPEQLPINERNEFMSGLRDIPREKMDRAPQSYKRRLWQWSDKQDWS